MHRTARKGFTLVEAAAAVAMTAALVGVLAPAGMQVNTTRRGMTSQTKLGVIGVGASMYGQDHAGRIPGYSWRGPNPGEGLIPYILPDGSTQSAGSDTEAANIQNREILMRNTGRTTGPHRILSSSGFYLGRFMPHLPLQDYMGLPFPSELFADPADAKLLQWQANPLDISGNNSIPYASSGWGPGHHEPGSFTTAAIRQRWAYTTSFDTVPVAYGPDAMPTFLPVSGSSYLFQIASGTRVWMGRGFDEVAFPSAKVYMFEEFDRERGLPVGGRWYAFPTSFPDKLMFDGSIDSQVSSRALSSFRPDQAQKFYGPWRQRYTPLHEFPTTPLGLGDNTQYDMRWRWTLRGLGGLDYPQRFSPPGR